MSRFATDLLHYLRDVLIVQTGGEDTHLTTGFSENLALEQARIFTMIEMVTRGWRTSSPVLNRRFTLK